MARPRAAGGCGPFPPERSLRGAGGSREGVGGAPRRKKAGPGVSGWARRGGWAGRQARARFPSALPVAGGPPGAGPAWQPLHPPCGTVAGLPFGRELRLAGRGQRLSAGAARSAAVAARRSGRAKPRRWMTNPNGPSAGREATKGRGRLSLSRSLLTFSLVKDEENLPSAQ